MATIGKIRYDLCGFIGDLESHNGNAILRTPTGWASVYPLVRLSVETGMSRLDQQKNTVKQKAVKERIAKKFPTCHLCPACLSEKKHWNEAGPLKLMPSANSAETVA